MADLIERYVHQVGLYLPPKERAEIEAELRSQIQDQLDDRCDEPPSQADVAAVLAELGDPRRMAASYNREQYLVGPDLYPYMMMVLRRGWLVVPAIVIFVSFFGVLTSAQAFTLSSLVVDPLLAALQAALIFSGVVVLIFAIVQHAGLELDEQVFNPLELPEVDDPRAVNRAEVVFGTALGMVAVIAALYWLRAGGLTLHFNLSDPGAVIPFPPSWMILLVAVIVAIMGLNLLALRRNRWSAGLWLTDTVIEVFGTICLYYAVTKPVFERIIADNPALGSTPVVGSLPEIFAVGYAVVALLTRGMKLVRLWNYDSSTPPYTVQPDA
jgi:hypothetical protein